MTFNSYIINDEVIFNMDVNELQPVAGKDHEAITLNTPTARCLQLLLESNGNIISRDEFLSAVWKERGVVVSQNTFYQNISLLRKSLLRAGLTQDVVVTVRQRGFVIATGTVIRQVTLQNEFNSAQPLSTDASMRIINDKYIAKIDDAEVQNSVRKTFRINGLTSRQLSWWTFIIVAIMAIINIIFYASNIFDFY
ncbi:winged helix-turn-helix domain-containing protein [Klebsiella pneumoniae]|uniref:winged helix-turn-helix domain-containing protein n=1 Tax=Klebsiella pneumoniae TaxID=573 RepID=UPI00124A2C62|nr:winged helix-turn-helix domain-containing protein [Klebsiella pneumoniae]EKZ5870352.1 winged helix-turn-helix domain-containing protein [Klebsiella pneumoniae]MBD7379188.1 winged helix-turn-helix domain-containing protein [Klebsiella pneumoniae]MBD7573819.1 winged helix-turn-helix domain-containing protein [Klebsiella pneumoniae]HBQ8159636.1 winged helix-turn-helix domain-containing protein [Klebsiella pneumoniae]HBS0700086.1 winged helix-turn-helix domain-containing protein [Klebsiella pne